MAKQIIGFIVIAATFCICICSCQKDSIALPNTVPGKDVILSLPPDIEIKMIWVEPIEKWMSETEITIRQYQAIASYRDIGYLQRFANYDGNWPVVNVTDEQCIRYAMKLGRRIGLRDYTLRLPTEIEWEKAAHGGGSDYSYPWGNAWPPSKMLDARFPNLRGMDEKKVGADFRNLTAGFQPQNAIPNYYDGHIIMAPVLQSGMNSSRLYGMAGNVNEFCYKADRTLVKKGGSYNTASKDDAMISNDRIVKPKPSPFGGIDSNGDFATGFRLVMEKSKSKNGH